MATTFRAVAMLAVLVGLPAAWIYYGPLPVEAQRVVDRLVTVAKDALGWNKPSPYFASDGKDLMYTSPAPALEMAAPGEPKQPLAAAAAEPKPLSLEERVQPLLTRLQQLGVVEYALERWGDGGELYRFHCAMPLSASAVLTQQFEAVAADPQASVEQVVADVAQWQLAQRSAGM